MQPQLLRQRLHQKNQVIADDCTPDETKASIQRMLAFCKYRADANKNKSGQGMAKAQEVLEASGLNAFLFSTQMNMLMLNRQAYREIGDSDRRGFIQAYRSYTTPRRPSLQRRKLTPLSKG